MPPDQKPPRSDKLSSYAASESADPKPDAEPITAFDGAIEVSDDLISWIDWTDEIDITAKSLCGALALLKSCEMEAVVDGLVPFLEGELAALDDGPEAHRSLLIRFRAFKRAAALKSSEFILKPIDDTEEIRSRFTEYHRVQVVLALTEFVLTHKPCCKLLATAWLIPDVAAGLPAINLVAYAAEQLADLRNDPVEPFDAQCTSVGNSWLHRLGIYLLHECQIQKIPPHPSLTRLMALVSLPPSAHSKSGKATRFYDYLSNSPYPVYLHESPPTHVIGKALALELLGEIDANRQVEHIRRIERAVAYYAVRVLRGETEPSARRLQIASGLSWTDAENLLRRSLLRRWAFEYQCRFLTVSDKADCPDCRRLMKHMPQKLVNGRMPASVGPSRT
jgi:hypothetical protein